MTKDPVVDPSDPSSQYPATLQIRKGLGKSIRVEFPAEQAESIYPTIVGDYELLSEIARGGMGIVYKARQRKLNRIVALKISRGENLAAAEDVLRLQAEATAAARLDHPNIVPIYEVGEAQGRRFFSMAFIEGEDLGQALAAGPLPPRRAAELIRQVAQAVAYAHQHGVIHRDLKPSNILLDAGGQPRVSDFGLAKCAETDSGLTTAGLVMGTPSFMPLEQTEGKTELVGPLADVYALGATLYCLVTGRPPFQAATPLETVKQVVEREPISPRQLNPAVDRDLDTICLKCLEKRPERRYASALALAEDLQRFLDQRPIQARPVGRLEKLERWRRRNPLLAASLATALGIFFVAFFLVSWSYWRVDQALADEKTQRQLAQQEQDEKRWALYRANIKLAGSAMHQHNVGVARQALDEAPEVHRNWEWRHFHSHLDVAQHVLRGPETLTGNAFFAQRGSRAFVTVGGVVHAWDTSSRKLMGTYPYVESPEYRTTLDGRLIAYVKKDNTVVVRDIDAGHELPVLAGHDAFVSSVRFSNDGKHLVTGSEDRTARVWDLRTGKQLRVFREHKSDVAILDMAENGYVLSVERRNFTCRTWDLATGKEIATYGGHDKKIVIRGAFSLQGDRLVTIEHFPTNTIRLWDTATGKLLVVMRGHTNQITFAEFSPDGKLIATSSMDQTVRLWNGVDSKPVATMKGHHGRVNRVRFSRDGKHLLTASQDQTIRLWDVATESQLAVLHGHTADIYDVAYTPDEKTIVSAARDGTIRLWDAQRAAVNGVFRGHTNFVYDVAFHPDGERVASASWDGTVRLWDATTGQHLSSLIYAKKTFVNSLAFHPSGRLIATRGRDDAVRLWDVGSGKEVHSMAIDSKDWRVCRLAFNAHGDMLATGNKDGAIYLWTVADASSEQAWLKPLGPTMLHKHGGAVRDLAFSPDGRWLAAASDDRKVSIWNVAEKKCALLLEKHTYFVYAVAWSHDGKLLASGSNDGTVRLWDTRTWQEIAVLKHGTDIHAVAFSPDGSRLASACVDNTVRFWDVATHKEVAELRGHDAYVHGLAFSPDGTRLATGGGDNTVRIWDTLTPQSRAKR